MLLRPDQPDQPTQRVEPAREIAARTDCHESQGTPRLNLLLSAAHWRYEPALDSLPHLLAPLGIQSITAPSGEEATEVIRSIRIHIAVVDLSIPMQKPCATIQGSSESSSRFAMTSAGPRVLQLLRRLDSPPPTVVVRPPPAAARESTRSLTEALREGAFAVLDRPVPLEAMLEVLRRIVRRHYADAWPT